MAAHKTAAGSGRSLFALFPVEAHACTAPITTTFAIGSALVFINHGRQVVMGEFPAWWVIALTYLLVYCAFLVGGVCSKLKCTTCMRRFLGMPLHQSRSLKTFDLSEVEEGNGEGLSGVEFEEGEILFPTSQSGDAIGSDMEGGIRKSIYEQTQGGKEDRKQLYLEESVMGADMQMGNTHVLMRDECPGMTPLTKKTPMICCESSRANNLHESASSFGLIDLPGMFEASDFQGIQPRIFLPHEAGRVAHGTPGEHSPGLGKLDSLCQPDESDFDMEHGSSLRATRPCQSNACHMTFDTGSIRPARLQHIGKEKTMIRRSQTTNTETFLTDHATRQVFVYKNALFLDNFAECDDTLEGKNADGGEDGEDNWKNMPHST